MNYSHSDVPKWVKVAKEFWLSEGIWLNDGAQLENFMAIESVVGFAFPEDMRKLYLFVNGFDKWDWTAGMICLWPLERIREEYLTGEDGNFVGFCDFLINSHRFGFFKDRPGIYKNYGRKYPVEHIADSFEQTILLINSNSELIY